jgi:hypothetical protein
MAEDIVFVVDILLVDSEVDDSNRFLVFSGESQGDFVAEVVVLYDFADCVCRGESEVARNQECCADDIVVFRILTH